MRRELAPALDLLETAIRESNADEYTQAEQVARGATTRTRPSITAHHGMLPC
jgi:hypothetical protein